MADQQPPLGGTSTPASAVASAAAAAAAADASAVNVSELGKALDQTTISSASAVASPAGDDVDVDDEPDEGDDEDDYEEDDDDGGDDGGDAADASGGFGDEYTAEELGMGVAGSSDEEDDDVAASPGKVAGGAAPAKSKSPKKRGRTDSLKKMLPAPAPQRHKQKDGAPAAPVGDAGGDDGAHKATPTKLLVKDRTGAGMGVPRPHLISNAVKQAPPAKEKSNPRRWSKHEDESLRLAVERSGERNWKAIADQVPGRNHTQCLQRWTKVLKPGLIKGHWTPEEDSKLRELVTEEKKNWGQVASLIPGRTSKQCRERWCNHLDPNINKGSYTEDEDKIIIEMQSKLGNRWSIIAQQLKGRTEDAVKIRWKSLMRGRRAAMKDEKALGAASHAAHAVSTAASASAADAKPKAAAAAPPAPAAPPVASAAAARAAPARPKARAPSPVAKATGDAPSAPDAAPAPAPAALELQPAALPLDGGDVKLEGLELAMSLPTDDLVAASLQSYQLNARFQSSHALGGAGGAFAPATSAAQTISPANHAMYTASNAFGAPPGAFGLQPPPPQAYSAMGGAYAMGSYGAMGVPPAALQYYAGVPNGLPQSVPQGYSQPGFGAPRQMYASYAGGAVFGAGVPMAQGFGAGAMAPPPQQQPGMFGGGSFSGGGAMPAAPQPTQAAAGGMNIGLPPSSAAAAAKMLATPREEWGSSQTPRSQMILTEGHASAYELFHQQRVRLMLQERDKAGLTLSSAPSPGQAMLTKELEANKERQKRQAIMQKGWKSAVEAMMASSDLSSLDDQQRFDGFLEKVTLSALDPTDDELINDIIADDSLDVETPVG